LYLYELASAAQLTPTDALAAAERLDGRGYVVFDRDKRFVEITRDGVEAREGISRSSLDDPGLKVGRSYVVTNDEPVEYEDATGEMTEGDIGAAIDAEISKYE
jgi:hypothetical protein